MPAGEIHQLIECPDCGMAVPDTSTHCWLCGYAMTAGLAPGPPRPPRPGRYEPTAVDWVLRITAWVVVAALGLLVAGTARDTPGLSVAIVVFASPAVLITAVASVRGYSGGRPLTGGERAGWFLAALTGTLAAVALLLVAGVVAFFMFCLYSLTAI